jgi:hypothetical protein
VLALAFSDVLVTPYTKISGVKHYSEFLYLLCLPNAKLCPLYIDLEIIKNAKIILSFLRNRKQQIVAKYCTSAQKDIYLLHCVFATL